MYGIQLVNLKSGSGIRIKLLESMAMGAPIVTTIIGVEGLNDACKDALLISENESAFIKNAVEMYKNKALRESTGKKGVIFTAEHHDFETIKKQFFEAIGHIS
jgi:glycosyltransferase involved in cell wall biosynthesis